MDLSSMYGGKALNAEDFEPKGRVLTISNVDVKVYNEGTANAEKKPRVFFEETDKFLGLNKTNYQTLCEIFGSTDTDDWIGERVRLYRATTMFNGNPKTPCIRVKAVSPKGNGDGGNGNKRQRNEDADDPDDDDAPF